MELYAYCFMPSHIHFIFRSSNEQPSELLRDFKRHTSKKVIEAIENNPQESRKEWLLWMPVLSQAERFTRAGKKTQLLVNINFGNIILNHIIVE
jgi:putative transposase